MFYKRTHLLFVSLFTLVILTVGSIAYPVFAQVNEEGKPTVVPTGFEIQNVYSRPALKGGNGAVYMKLENDTGKDIVFMSASTEMAQTVELHTMRMEEGVMRMRQVKGFMIPAGEGAELKPGQHHIMLIGLTRDFKVGDQFPITLTFDSFETRVQVKVESF